MNHLAINATTARSDQYLAVPMNHLPINVPTARPTIFGCAC